MNDLIEALQIIVKYLPEEGYSRDYPTHCEHDVMYVGHGIDKSAVSADDMARLGALGFSWNEDTDTGFMSFRFGSC